MTVDALFWTALHRLKEAGDAEAADFRNKSLPSTRTLQEEWIIFEPRTDAFAERVKAMMATMRLEGL